jgi:two-component system NarL family sensor kinase
MYARSKKANGGVGEGRTSAAALVPLPSVDPEALLRSALDSLSAHVAVLDGGGSIVFVNRAWKAFAVQCGYQGESAGVGLNYLAVCERSAPASKDAARTAKALRDLMVGRRRTFRMEYPCEGPNGARWFQLRITRPEDPTIDRIVMAHEDITEVKLAHTELTRLTNRLMRVQDDERRSLARELHDTTAQNLFAVALNLTKARERLRKGMVPTDQSLTEMFDLVEQSLQEVRTLSYVLHPPLLDVVGLGSALKWLASGFSERSGIAVEAVADDGPDLPHEAALALFRVAQECLTNVHRHSGSKWARLSLTRGGGQVRLEVLDGGCGLRESGGSEPVRVGVGLAGMRVRIEQLGGALDLEAGSWGTRVRATLPMTSAAVGN